MKGPVQVGETVSHYRIVADLGAGGMGVVYRAEDVRLGRHVAVKFLAPELTRDANARRRLLAEAQAASTLDHRNICTLYEVEEAADGTLFLVMAYYPGETLMGRLERGPLQLEQAIDLAMQIAEGLNAAHVHGIVHRDLKPANVIITAEGVAKIIDFGLAQWANSTRLTEIGKTWGTVAYMSPEQARGDVVDKRTDLWALGVMLYEMISGHRPFATDSSAATLYAILNAAPQPLDRIRSGIPSEVSRLITRALEKRAGDRFQTADELLEALRSSQRGRKSGPVGQVVDDHRLSIAVLPFSDMSPKRDQDYFCEGVAEELICALTGVSDLHVVSRTSAFQFKGQPIDIGEIGFRLKADAVLEGSVRTYGTQLRIAVRLVNVADGYDLWSERYDRDMSDIFAVQDEIARSIVEKLKGQMRSESDAGLVRPHTHDLEAYNLYLQGRYYWSRRYAGFLGRALECFEQAVARDASYALAHTGVADAYTVLGVYGAIRPRVAFGKSKQAAECALVLNDALPEAHQAFAFVEWYLDWDWIGAEQHYRRALALNKESGLTHAQFGVFLSAQARFAEAIAEVTTGVALDPVSLLVGFYSAATRYNTREYDKALEECSRVLELDPNFALALWIRTLTLSELERHNEAIETAQRALSVSKTQPFYLSALGVAYARAGHHAETQHVLEELTALSETAYVMPLHFADIYTALRSYDEACTWMERACDDRNGFATYIGTLPLYDGIRSDERFARLVGRIGLAKKTEHVTRRTGPTSTTEQTP